MKIHQAPWFKSIGLVLLLIVSSASFAYEEQDIYFSDDELAQILAPIALYPDTLLTHILIASTYPIEVIDADRWVSDRSSLTKAKLIKKAAKKDWDDSVKALIAFPKVLSKLSEDLGWMRKLGDAFLQDEERVLASIQQLRQLADEAGSLAQMNNVDVIREKRVIIIEPVEPDIVYVPYYDPRVVYGSWHWGHSPHVIWPDIHVRHRYYHGPFYWDVGVHIGFDFFFSAFHWHNRHVIVNHHNRHEYRPRKRIVTSHHAKRWHHKPSHRRGVAYSSGQLKQKFSSSRPSVHHSKKVRLANVNSNKVKVIKNRHQDFSHKLKVTKERKHELYNDNQRQNKRADDKARIKARSNHQAQHKKDYKNNRSKPTNTQPSVNKRKEFKSREVTRTKSYQTKEKSSVNMTQAKSYIKTRSEPKIKHETRNKVRNMSQSQKPRQHRQHN